MIFSVLTFIYGIILLKHHYTLIKYYKLSLLAIFFIISVGFIPCITLVSGILAMILFCINEPLLNESDTYSNFTDESEKNKQDKENSFNKDIEITKETVTKETAVNYGWDDNTSIEHQTKQFSVTNKKKAITETNNTNITNINDTNDHSIISNLSINKITFKSYFLKSFSLMFIMIHCFLLLSGVYISYQFFYTNKNKKWLIKLFESSSSKEYEWRSYIPYIEYNIFSIYCYVNLTAFISCISILLTFYYIFLYKLKHMRRISLNSTFIQQAEKELLEAQTSGRLSQSPEKLKKMKLQMKKNFNDNDKISEKSSKSIHIGTINKEEKNVVDIKIIDKEFENQKNKMKNFFSKQDLRNSQIKDFQIQNLGKVNYLEEVIKNMPLSSKTQPFLNFKKQEELNNISISNEDSLEKSKNSYIGLEIINSNYDVTNRVNSNLSYSNKSSKTFKTIKSKNYYNLPYGLENINETFESKSEGTKGKVSIFTARSLNEKENQEINDLINGKISIRKYSHKSNHSTFDKKINKKFESSDNSEDLV